MSERNSTPSPISGSASDKDGTANDDLTTDLELDLDLGFDGDAFHYRIGRTAIALVALGEVSPE